MVLTLLPKKALLHLLRNFNKNHTISSISEEFSMHRVGIWRVLKKLEAQNYVKLIPFDNRKTSTHFVKLNWSNILLEKLLSFYLTEDALKEEKWHSRLKGLERIVELLVLHNPEDETKKITILSVIPNKKIKIHHTSGELEEEREINTINLTEPEFIQEFIKKNPNFLNQLRHGNVLFGQEKFIQIMKQIHLRNSITS
jgi:hypothetical protein